MDHTKQIIKKFAWQSIMLLPIRQIRANHLNAITHRRIGRAAATEMCSCCFRKKNHFPIGISESFAPVHILCVEEESFVKHTDLFNRLSSREPETATQHFHLCFILLLPMTHLPSGKKRRT